MIQHATATALPAVRGTAPSQRGAGGRDFLSLLASSAVAAPPRPARAADVPEDRKVVASGLDASPVEPDDAALTGAWFVASMPPALAATAPGVELDPGPGSVDATTDLDGRAATADHGTGLLTDDGPAIQAPAEGRAGAAAGALVPDHGATQTTAGTGDAPGATGDALGSVDVLETIEVEPGAPGPVAPADGAGTVDDATPALPRDAVPTIARGTGGVTVDPHPSDGPSRVERDARRVAGPGGETAATAGLDVPTPGRAEGTRAAEPTILTSSALTRLLDAIEQLEHAPPPRQLTLELGEVRIRLAMEDGVLRLQLLGEQRSEDRELLRDAEEALLSRGFDLREEGGRGDRPADHPAPDRAEPGLPRPRAAARTASRLPPVGLHL